MVAKRKEQRTLHAQIQVSYLGVLAEFADLAFVFLRQQGAAATVALLHTVRLNH